MYFVGVTNMLLRKKYITKYSLLPFTWIVLYSNSFQKAIVKCVPSIRYDCVLAILFINRIIALCSVYMHWYPEGFMGKQHWPFDPHNSGLVIIQHQIRSKSHHFQSYTEVVWWGISLRDCFSCQEKHLWGELVNMSV